MAIAVNIKDKCGPSNKGCRQLKLKKAIKIAKKVSYASLLLARRSMALAVDIMHGDGPQSNEMHTQLKPPKKTRVRPY